MREDLKGLDWFKLEEGDECTVKFFDDATGWV